MDAADHREERTVPSEANLLDSQGFQSTCQAVGGEWLAWLRSGEQVGVRHGADQDAVSLTSSSRACAGVDADQVLLAGRQESGRDERAAKACDGAGLAELVEVVVGAAEFAGEQSVDQSAARAGQVADEAVGIRVAGQVLAQRTVFDGELVGGGGE
jgi:hypothetical protein